MKTLVLTALLAASCADAGDKVSLVRAGGKVTLTGRQGVLMLANRRFSPPVTIEAHNATFEGIVLTNVDGVVIKGGTVIGPGGRSYGIKLLGARKITLDSMTITGAHRGIVIDRSSEIVVRGNTLTGLISDGVDIAGSQKISIINNSCSKFSPTLPWIDPTGKYRDGDHPDCIQGWSPATQAPTSDILIEGNVGNGTMQGVFFGDKAGGVGFDRVIIRKNVFRLGMGNGIAITNSRETQIQDNRVSSVIGAVYLRNGRQVRTNITTGTSSGVFCGNVVADFPNHVTSRPC